MSRVSVIIVNWNTRDLLARCLTSVYASAATLADLEVLVVDNGSRDGSADMVSTHFPAATLIANPHNAGFAAANNLAIRRATGDYILLLNPDAEVVGGAIPELVRYAESHPAVAVVGPKLLNSDGTLQPSRRGFPTRATAFLESTVLQRWLPNHPALRRYYLLDRSDEETQEVDWLVGACLLVRNSAIRKVGLLDEGYFMYSEELDWCRRFSRAGWKTVYHPAAQVIHHGGQSSDQDILHRHTRFQHSKCRYFETYHGRAMAQVLRVFMLANYLYLFAEDVAKLPFPRNRGMRVRRLGTLGRVLAWQVRWIGSWGKMAPQ